MVNVENKVKTRSNSEPFDKKRCIVCQQDRNETLHKVMYLSTGENMLSVAKNLEDQAFFRRLNAINCASDGVANDVLYHHLCWNSAKRKAEANSNPENHESMKVISNIELLNYVRLNVRPNQKKLIDMNDVNSAYENILLENGESAEIASGDRKKIFEVPNR